MRGLGAQDEWTAKGPPYRARGIVASGRASGGQLELTAKGLASTQNGGTPRGKVNMDGQPRSTRYIYVSHWDSMRLGTWTGRIKLPWRYGQPRAQSATAARAAARLWE